MRAAVAELPNVEAELWPGLLADFAADHHACAIVRGVRNATDFDVEYQLALINRGIYPELETGAAAGQPGVPVLQLLHGPGDDPVSPAPGEIPARLHRALVREMTEKKEG